MGSLNPKARFREAPRTHHGFVGSDEKMRYAPSLDWGLGFHFDTRRVVCLKASRPRRPFGGGFFSGTEEIESDSG